MKKQIYYLSTKIKNNHHAGSKAINDVDDILRNRIDTKPISVAYFNHLSLIPSICKLIARLLFSKHKIVIIQETGANKLLFLLKIMRKIFVWNHHIYVGLIHDLINLREEKVGQEEQKLLKLYDYLISHNGAMTKYLVSKGFQAKRIVNLEVFDYLLVNVPMIKREYHREKVTLAFAGNLSKEKSGFIYKMKDVIGTDIHLNLYGVYFDDTYQDDKITYHGSFAPEQLPHVIDGNFGLVWDGDTTTGCGGKFGRYMRYNNPHKLSFYLASKLPIIIWKEAALATFVIKRNIGIAIDNLSELSDKIRNISSASYELMCENVTQIGNELYNGTFTNRALDAILMKIASR